MAPLMERYDGLWLGWPGDALPGRSPAAAPASCRSGRRRHGYVAVEIPARISRSFYEGYANDTLWPLLHGFTTRVDLRSPRAGSPTATPTSASPTRCCERCRPGDLVWVHDYQLMLVPAAAARARAAGAHRLLPAHPLPVVRGLPHPARARGDPAGPARRRRDRLPDARRPAQLPALAPPGARAREPDGPRPRRRPRRSHLAALPIGIEADELGHAHAAIAKVEQSHRRAARAAPRPQAHRLASTGSTTRRASRSGCAPSGACCKASPDWRGRVTLVQVAVPSRERVPAYAELRREVAELVGRGQRRLRHAGVAARGLHAPLGRQRRAGGALRGRRRGLGGPAARRHEPGGQGVRRLPARWATVCSCSASSPARHRSWARRCASTPTTRWARPRRSRVPWRWTRRPAPSAWLRCHERVQRNDAVAWGDRFIEGLQQAARMTGPQQKADLPTPEPVALGAAMARARSRLLLLDYDGTLVPFARRPRDAVPGRDLLDLVAGLAAVRDTTVALISGRSRADLDRWFGDIPGLWLAAEHGALLRPPTGSWEHLRDGADTAWMQVVRPVLEQFADSAPGAFVEQKELALGWHYRLADAEFGAWLANELVATLENLLAGTEADRPARQQGGGGALRLGQQGRARRSPRVAGARPGRWSSRWAMTARTRTCSCACRDAPGPSGWDRGRRRPATGWRARPASWACCAWLSTS